MDLPEMLGSRAELFFKALAGAATEVRCEQCEVTEWVVPLDTDLDSTFFATYRCDECEAKGGTSGTPRDPKESKDV